MDRRIDAAATALALGVLGGLGWWVPALGLGALAVILLDPDDPRTPGIAAGGLAIGTAVALATSPWLAAPTDAERLVGQAIGLGLCASALPRVRGPGIPAAIVASVAGGAAVAGVVPGGWVTGPAWAALAGLGLAVPGLPMRLLPGGPGDIGLAVGVAVGAAIWRRRSWHPALLGLAAGSAVACWPFQRPAPARLDGWLLGATPRAADVARVDPRWWPSEAYAPDGWQVALAVAGVAAGVLLGALSRPAPAPPRTAAAPPLPAPAGAPPTAPR